MRHQPFLRWDEHGILRTVECQCDQCENRRLAWAVLVLVVAGGTGVWLLLSACLS